jgi:S-adenosylmethionine:tRNA ribosyltransferase-isomerase
VEWPETRCAIGKKEINHLITTVSCMNAKDIAIRDYTYELPLEKIASHPLPNRDDSRLLIYDRGTITEDVYRNLSSHLPANSLLVLNNTKVVGARIIFQKPTGASKEIFFL